MPEAVMETAQASESSVVAAPAIPADIGEDFGPEKHGATLQINPKAVLIDGAVAIDVETDEKDNFVGAALCGGDLVCYYTDLALLKWHLENRDPRHCEDTMLVGHNLKGDLHWLKKWGVNVSEKNLYFDTMIASYVTNPIRESHGLKPLSETLLALKWPTYAQMVGKGRKRVTLDKQEVARVARYCGMDCLATWRLYTHFQRVMTPNQRRVFSQIEMPVNRLLFRIEEKGVNINVAYLAELDKEFSQRIQEILDLVHRLTVPEIERMLLSYRVEQLKEKWEHSGYKAMSESGRFNPGSWQQKRLLLKFLGMEVESTDKRHLLKFKGNKLIDLLLQHSEFAKLHNAFIKAFQGVETLPTIHTTFNQVSEAANDEDDQHGIRTGRLSCKSPNLQQIPSRTENGRKLRSLFIPREGQTLIVADYSQIELRLAAHFSHDPILCNAFRSGEDVHDATAKALNVDRFYGKTANFLLAFRGSHWRLMDVINAELQKQGKPLITEVEALKFYDLYWSRFKVLGLWESRAIRQARVKGGVSTLLGRWIPVENLNSDNPKIRGKAERRAISCIIQGSAADIMKLSMLSAENSGYLPLLTVHDELVFEVGIDGGNDATDVGYHLDVEQIKDIMETVVKLDVPLEVSIGNGPNWGEAKQ